MTNEEKFVNELIGYIFAYPDDDYMTMECLCRKLHKHELIAKVNGHWQPLDKRCEECIFVEGSHWCNGCDKTPKGMKEYDEYWAKADRKTEPQTHDLHTNTHECVKDTHDKTSPNNSEKPNNCECEPRKEQNFCGKCRYLYRDFKYGLSCYRLMDNEPCKYEERKDEPSDSEIPNNFEDLQDWKDQMWAEAIVTEPTISKMEQVDEPQYDAEDQFCIEHNCPHFYQFGGCMNQGDCPYDEDEPQTERSE